MKQIKIPEPQIDNESAKKKTGLDYVLPIDAITLKNEKTRSTLILQYPEISPAYMRGFDLGYERGSYDEAISREP